MLQLSMELRRKLRNKKVKKSPLLPLLKCLPTYLCLLSWWKHWRFGDPQRSCKRKGIKRETLLFLFLLTFSFLVAVVANYVVVIAFLSYFDNVISQFPFLFFLLQYAIWRIIHRFNFIEVKEVDNRNLLSWKVIYTIKCFYVLFSLKV